MAHQISSAKAILACTLLALVFSFSKPAAAGVESVYYVGNSLTWDAIPNGGITDLAAQVGHTHNAGYHICCGRGLDYI